MKDQKAQNFTRMTATSLRCNGLFNNSTQIADALQTEKTTCKLRPHRNSNEHPKSWTRLQQSISSASAHSFSDRGESGNEIRVPNPGTPLNSTRDSRLLLGATTIGSSLHESTPTQAHAPAGSHSRVIFSDYQFKRSLRIQENIHKLSTQSRKILSFQCSLSRILDVLRFCPIILIFPQPFFDFWRNSQRGSSERRLTIWQNHFLHLSRPHAQLPQTLKPMRTSSMRKSATENRPLIYLQIHPKH